MSLTTRSNAHQKTTHAKVEQRPLDSLVPKHWCGAGLDELRKLRNTPLRLVVYLRFVRLPQWF